MWETDLGTSSPGTVRGETTGYGRMAPPDPARALQAGSYADASWVFPRLCESMRVCRSYLLSNHITAEVLGPQQMLQPLWKECGHPTRNKNDHGMTQPSHFGTDTPKI